MKHNGVKLWTNKVLKAAVLKQAEAETPEYRDFRRDWVNDYINGLCWGLNTVGCLGFLHGIKGQTKIKVDKKPKWMKKYEQEFHGVVLEKRIHRYWAEIYWTEGKIKWRERSTDDQYPYTYKEKIMRLGKWLKKIKATPEEIKEFETRDLAYWKYEVSAHPADLLTMSYGRPWISCLRPGTEFEQGLFSDLKAGSAVIFWYRPGRDKPCGREVLRPAVIDNKPAIIRGGVVYGSGPKVSSQALKGILGIRVLKRNLTNKETPGAIIKNLYCDNQQGPCNQSSYEAELAEQHLRNYWTDYINKSTIYDTLPISLRRLRKKKNRRDDSYCLAA